MDTKKNKAPTAELKSATLVVPGMGSNHCSGLVTTSLQRLEGVSEIKTNIANHHVDVEFDGAKLQVDTLRDAVERAGYDVDSVTENQSGGTVRLTVPGMGSNHCAGIIKESIERLPGILDVGTNIATHFVKVSFVHGITNDQAIKLAVEKAGYDVAAMEGGGKTTPATEDDVEERYLKKAWSNFWYAAIPTTLIMLLMAFEMFWQHIPGYLLIIAILAFPVIYTRGGMGTHRSAWRSLTNRTANMDVGHGATYSMPGGGPFGEGPIAWLKFQLQKDVEAAAIFIGPDCGLCRDEVWQLRRHRME